MKFEHGYSVLTQDALVLWKAQLGEEVYPYPKEELREVLKRTRELR